MSRAADMNESLIADVACGPDERLAVPGPGRVLSSVAETRGRHIRAAASLIERALSDSDAKDLLADYLPLQGNLIQAPNPEPAAQRCGWIAVNIWLLARQGTGRDLSFAEAESWFLGTRHAPITGRLPENVAVEAVSILKNVASDRHFTDLLPYALEPHGPGSRLSVIKDSATLTARKAKKEKGVFYTPVDVAEYMVRKTLARNIHATPNCIDPACGTGVFLLALLREASSRFSAPRLEIAANNLFGFDISPLAIESAVFVLLHECLEDLTERQVAPYRAWHSLRLNFAAVDSLIVDAKDSVVGHSAAREKLKRTLLSSRKLAPQDAKLAGGEPSSLIPLGALFPEIGAGCDVLVGNPPYAALGECLHQSALRDRYASLAGLAVTGSENIYSLFIELQWRLTKKGHNASALVVPLSIAYSQKNQFKQCRQAMSYHGGRWDFAFFDREPHALFGEDVKTRNAIVFRTENGNHPRRGEQAEIFTGPLQKWTSRTRARLFSSLSFTQLGSLPIAAGVPKIGNSAQAEGYLQLKSKLVLGDPLWSGITTASLEDAASGQKANLFYIGGTAYNFLNVFRQPPEAARSTKSLSESGLHSVQCPSEQLSHAAFALFSSRLAFWLWHVEGDGFHVPRMFLERVPFGASSFSDGQLRDLAALGQRLWNDLQEHQVVSVNKGKTSFAFRPLACEAVRDEIDEILVTSAGLPRSFTETLRSFVRQTVVVDETDLRREKAMEFFVREVANAY